MKASDDKIEATFVRTSGSAMEFGPIYITVKGTDKRFVWDGCLMPRGQDDLLKKAHWYLDFNEVQL